MQQDSDYNPNFYCPITCEIFEDPVVDKEGNTFERCSIEEWLNKHGKSPITRTPMDCKDLRPNRAIKSAIEIERQRGYSGPTKLEGEHERLFRHKLNLYTVKESEDTTSLIWMRLVICILIDILGYGNLNIQQFVDKTLKLYAVR